MQTAAKKEVISVENVTKSYELGSVSVKALQGVSFKVHEGERISIIGPSGCGKSTLLHMLGLLDIPTTGRLLLDGTDVSSLGQAQLAHFRGKKIGFIFQSFFLIPSMDAISNVALPMMFYDVPEKERLQRAKAVLERLGMGERLHHLPSELSGGQRQRVAIARALVNEPSVILADEPTGNLDSHSGDEVLKIFDELHAEGKTIIVVTHDHHIAHLSPRIIRLKDGMVESDGARTHQGGESKEAATPASSTARKGRVRVKKSR